MSIESILFLLISISLILIIVMGLKLSESFKRVDELSSQVNDVQSELRRLADEFHEVRTGAMGLGKSVNTVKSDLAALQGRIEQVADMDPATKIYSQAVELLQSGMSIEHVMAECDLPRAEVELLANLNSAD